jgi:hypothetical protein
MNHAVKSVHIAMFIVVRNQVIYVPIHDIQTNSSSNQVRKSQNVDRLFSLRDQHTSRHLQAARPRFFLSGDSRPETGAPHSKPPQFPNAKLTHGQCFQWDDIEVLRDITF